MKTKKLPFWDTFINAKRLLAIGLTATSLFIFSCTDKLETITPKPAEEEATTTDNNLTENQAGRVDANAVASGNMRGINALPCYLGDGNTNYSNIAGKKYNTVRIEWDPSKVSDFPISELQSDVTQALDAGLQVIITWHNQEYFKIGGSQITGPGPTHAYTLFWDDMIIWINQQANKDRIVINVLNEWGGDNATQWLNEYRKFYTLLSNTDPRKNYTGRVIIDVGRFGNQFPTRYGKGNYISAIKTLKNLYNGKAIFAVHFYEDSGLQQSDLEDVEEAAGGTVITGEFGLRWFSGGTDSNGIYHQPATNAEKNAVAGLIKKANGMGWGRLGWAWDGDGEGMVIKNDEDYRKWINPLIGPTIVN